MISDSILQEKIIDELRKNHNLYPEHIGVSVSDDIVTLFGYTATYDEKKNVDDLVENIAEVKAIVENIEVKLKGPMFIDDDDIAKAILENYKWSALIPEDKIKFFVSEGWVTLKGEVEWDYQKNAAENLAHSVEGVKHVSNLIQLKSKVTKDNLKENIQKYLKANSRKNISVDILNDKVTLSGEVDSMADMKFIEKIAWNCTGISTVNNLLAIRMH